MLRHTSAIHGYSIGATDGPIGAVSDVLFDDQSWRVRWLVVDTGGLLGGRTVLLPTSALSRVDHMGRQLAVNLTKQQLKDGPAITADQPVSRQMESDLYDYYGWGPYWSMGFYMGGYYYPGGPYAPNGGGVHARDHAAEETGHPHGDIHLRSVREVTGYHIHARDGEIGHISDFLLEDGDWSVHYLVVSTQDWWPGKKVLISPRSILSTNWSTRTVSLDVDKATVKDSPAYDGSQEVDRAYEYAFHGYYDGRRVIEPV